MVRNQGGDTARKTRIYRFHIRTNEKYGHFGVFGILDTRPGHIGDMARALEPYPNTVTRFAFYEFLNSFIPNISLLL